MSIVKYKDSRTGVTYAYESISYYDPEKKQARPKRKYLGKVDEETGEIISTTGSRGRPRKDGQKPKSADTRLDEAKALIAQQKETIKNLEARISALEKERKYIHDMMTRLLASLES